MKILLTCAAICMAIALHAQDKLVLHIRSKEGTLPHATIFWKERNQHFVADSTGSLRIRQVPDGLHHFTVSHTGMKKMTWSSTFPLSVPDQDIELEEAEEEEEEVIVTATRTSRTIANTVTRTEVISGEELAEKANMKPGDIRMLLNESTGIQTQQTSATSYNSSIRIQGLDGRYTQILKDGLPLYAGFSGGLSLMQVTPLDLRQVEVIKGSSSTLYGGGAIAGLVNLVSRTPGAERELRFLTNVTSAGGLDLSGFYSERYGKTGMTLFASRNTSRAYDPAGNGFTAIPKVERYTVNPRLFLYGERLNANIGVSYIIEDRTGGSMGYITKNTPGYFEYNRTKRFTGQSDIRYNLAGNAYLQLKNSYNHFRRVLEMEAYRFAGTQQSTFTELDLHAGSHTSEWITGLTVVTDKFKEDASAVPVRDYAYSTIGAFIQHTLTISEQMTVETGIRGDHVSSYGFVLLPRISGIYKATPQFTVRAGAGMGYKTPTIFNEESERMHFRNIQPVQSTPTAQERSGGANIDLNYRIRIGETGISINQLFFYTRLNQPLVAVAAGGSYRFENAAGHIDTRGFETNLKLSYHAFKLFTGYTYADVNTHFNGQSVWLPLTARHRLNNVLMYEKEGNWKIGLEAYYVSRQVLSDQYSGRAYWTAGLMAEKNWGIATLFINFENFTDTRQSKFEPIYSGPASAPQFRDIYAPVDGFVVNGGLKLSW